MREQRSLDNLSWIQVGSSLRTCLKYWALDGRRIIEQFKMEDVNPVFGTVVWRTAEVHECQLLGTETRLAIFRSESFPVGHYIQSSMLSVLNSVLCYCDFSFYLHYSCSCYSCFMLSILGSMCVSVSFKLVQLEHTTATKEALYMNTLGWCVSAEQVHSGSSLPSTMCTSLWLISWSTYCT